jgi:hypothetical protein
MSATAPFMPISLLAIFSDTNVVSTLSNSVILVTASILMLANVISSDRNNE